MNNKLLGLTLALFCCNAFAEQVWYDVNIDGRAVSMVGAEFERQDNVLIAPPSQWMEAGIILDEQEKAQNKLSSVDLGLTLDIDEAQQTVVIKALVARLPKQTFNTYEKQEFEISPSAKGVLFGYDLAASTDGKSVNASVGHSVSTTVGKGVLLHTGQFNITQDEAIYRRGFSTYTYDNPDTLRSIQVGDIQTRPQNSPSSPVLMGGIRIAKDPTLETRPLFAVPVLGGVATDTSTVQAIVNGNKQNPLDVSSGSFEIINPGLNSGLNTTSLVIRDQFGRETVIDQTQYFSPSTLRKGLSMWEVNVGKVRQGTSDTYTTDALSASYSLGVNDNWTFDAHTEGTRDASNVSAGVRGYGRFGAVGLSVGQSTSHNGTGRAYSGNYAYSTKDWSVGANIIQQNNAWWDLSQATGNKGPLRATSIYASRRIGERWQVRGSVGKYEQGDYEDVRGEVRLNYGDRTNNLSVGVAKTSQDTTVALTYTRRFAQRTSGGVDFRQNSRGSSYGVNAQGQSNVSSGNIYWGGRLGQTGDIVYGSAVGRLVAEKYDANVRLDVYDGQSTLSGGYSSGLWMGEGVVQQVKTQGLTIAVIKVPGVEGVPVFLENKPVGKTNKAGVLVIGPVRQLEVNNINIDVRALPAGFDIINPTIKVSPNRNHVALVEYKPDAQNARSFRLRRNNEDIAMGTMLSDNETMVGYDGEVYLDNPQPLQTLVVEGVCKAVLPKVMPKYSETPILECL